MTKILFRRNYGIIYNGVQFTVFNVIIDGVKVDEIVMRGAHAHDIEMSIEQFLFGFNVELIKFPCMPIMTLIEPIPVMVLCLN